MNAQTKIEEARTMYRIAIANRDKEMIAYWDHRLNELNR